MKVAIYCRVSTIEQYPESQIKDCLEFANNKGYEVPKEYIFVEKLSAFKQIERPKYEKVKELARTGKVKAVIVWAFDRWVRNRDTLIEDTTLLSNYGVKLHSVKDAWLEAINIEGALGKTIREFLLGLIGSLGELESSRKSERVKIAYERVKAENRKYKKWGRKSLPKRVIVQVLELHNQGLSMRKIANEMKYYDKNNNEKKVSIGAVHKIITENKQHFI